MEEQLRETLYIHIGVPKTGTTSFQYLMAQNRDLLRQIGIYYPNTMHRLFASASQHRYLFVASQHDDTSAREELIQEIKASGAPRALISEENLCWNPELQAAYLAPLRDVFDVKVLMLVRRQDELAESFYVQTVRGGYDRSFEEFLSSANVKRMLDYLYLADCWANAFGAENVIIRRYRGISQPAEETLLSLLEFPSGIELRPSADSMTNRSISAEAVQFFWELQKRKLPLAYASFNEIFGEALAAATVGPPARFFSPDERRSFLERFEESNKGLVNAFLGGDGPLFEAITDWPEPVQLGNLSEQRQVEIYRSIFSGAEAARLEILDAMAVAASTAVSVPDIDQSASRPKPSAAAQGADGEINGAESAEGT